MAISLFYVGNVLWKDDDAAIQWMIVKGIIPSKKRCHKCGSEMKIDKQRGLGLFRCRKLKKHVDGLEVSVCVASGTWLEGSKVSPVKVLLLLYCFATDMTFSDAVVQTSLRPGESTSTETVSDWYSNSREAVSDYMYNQQMQEGKLGGVGKVVEVDETKFGKRKYNVGRMRDGKWICGMIEIETGRFRTFLCPNNKRDEATLLPIILANVLPGTTIMTDKWRAYRQLVNHGYNHLTVNHSVNFVDPTSGAHTQHIEASWRPLKTRLRSRGINAEDDMADHLLEYLWKRKVKRENQCPLDAFVEVIRHAYPI